MLSTSRQSDPDTTRKSNKFSYIFWIIGLLLLAFYGFLSFNSGIKLSPLSNTHQNSDAVIAQIIKQADQNQPIAATDIEQVVPTWARLSAQAGSEKFTYGSDSVAEALLTYHQMQKQGKQTLSTHMMLGTILMVFGILQFWPTFRMKYPKTHRVMGGIYIGAAMISMSMSIYHLIHTGPDKTYGEFSFFFGLWFLAIGAIASILLATYYIKKRDIVKHMGWQALAFGFFLTAPIQRLNWIVLPYFFAPYTTFNEMNYLVNVCLVIETLLLSYLLFHVNRTSLNSAVTQASLPLQSRRTPRFAPNNTMICAFMAFCWAGFIAWYALWPSFAQHNAALIMFPTTLIQADQAIYAKSHLHVVYAGAVGILLSVLAIWYTHRDFFMKKRLINLLLTATLVSIAILWKWAFVMGLPSHQTSAGGTFFAMIGTLMLFFVLLGCWNYRKQQYFLLNENLRFLMIVTVAPTLAYLSIHLIEAIHLVPERFWAKGHAYQLSMITAILVPLLLAYIYTVYDAIPRPTRT